MPPHHQRPHRRTLVRRHFTESSKIITWNATQSPTDLFRRHFTESLKKITWNATQSPTDLVRRHFTESSKIITWNATQSSTATPTDLRPSAFHREFENNYLKCHPITDGHTDAFKSVGKLSAVQFYRQHYRRTARISKGCALNAPLTA
jgi:hypothetical protein